MAAGVISVGGKKFAVGLYWQVSDSANAAKNAKAAAKQPGAAADYYCVRSGNTKGRAPQFGLGEQRFGHGWNMPAAAASLANRQPGSWAGVFVVPEGVWFVEVRDDLIAPEGDQMFADEAEAMGRLQEASARGGLEKIYAPASWAIPGAESSSLPSLLSGRADARLQPVRLPAKAKKAIAGALVGSVLLGVAGYYVMDMREQAEMDRLAEEARNATTRAHEEEEQRRQQEEVRRQQEEVRRQQEMARQILQAPAYQRVWENLPKPIDWLAACRVAFENVQVAPLGWTLGAVVCSGSQVTVSWTRGTGPAVIPSGAQVDPTMRAATASFDLPALPPRGLEQLWPADAIVLYSLTNDWQADLSYLPDLAPKPMPDGRQLPPPPWLKRSVNWTVPLSPWTLKGPLVDLPGLVIESLTWTQAGEWQIQGVLYEQRK
jgi:hypothetical protein